MATSSTRDDSASPVDQSIEQSIVARPAGWLAAIRQFQHEVMLEMKKVSWPSRTEVVNTTVIVVIAIFFFSVYLFLADIFFTYLISGIEWAAKKVFG